MEEESNTVDLDMLQAHSRAMEHQGRLYHYVISTVTNSEPGKHSEQGFEHPLTPSTDFLMALHTIVNSPPDMGVEYNRIKKDLFHAFHMIPISVNHGLRPLFLRTLRDHIMWWDPIARSAVDKVCRTVFGLTFDQMLLRNPRFIAARTPCYVPPPSVLVPVITKVADTFGNSLDAKTGQPLFSKLAWAKMHAVIDLARMGYLSDMEGVVLYEKAGIDQYGLQKYRCMRGTNNVEGGPHSDIYKTFGALHGMILSFS